MAATALALAVTGCKPDPPPTADAASSAASASPAAVAAGSAQTAPAPSSAPLSDAPGDPARGHELVAQFQCNRCHNGTGLPAAALDAHCVQCHQNILAGQFNAPATTMARWQANLVQLREVPSLTALGKRYRRDWIERFLLEPYDLRPRLHATMPRLAITAEQAKDIATYLTTQVGTAPGEQTQPASATAQALPPLSLEGASPAKGRALIEAKGCGSCHAFTGVAPFATVAPIQPSEKETRPAISLAPDLRFTRDRFRPAELVVWLLDPKAVKPDTAMPLVPLSAGEARDMAAYLLTAPLSLPEPKPIPARLPILTRKVTFKEVRERVFYNTCRHCHSEPDYALGDGGPGNTGGFGFKPRGLNLAVYEGVAAGYLDEHGERHSVFSPMPDGTPRLVAALLARQAEEAGRPDPAIRGMPLGLPALGPEEVQVLETWIAQGRPQ